MPQPQEQASPLPRLAVACALAAGVAWFLPFFTLGIERLVDDWTTLPIADDAFYFLQIARHLAAGHGSTFDGVHPTDGFQPLWCWLLAGVQWLGGGSPEGLVRAALALACGLLVATAVQCGAFVRDAGIDRRLAALLALGVALWSPLSTGYFTLCEAALNGFLFVVALRAAVPVFHGTAGPARQFAFGLVLGLLFLARLDNFLLVAVLLLALLVHRGRAAVPVLARIAATLAPPALGYVAYQAVHFGHVMPISGAVKSMRSGPIAWTDPVWWIECLQTRLAWFLAPHNLATNRVHVARALAAVAVLALALPVRWWLAQRPAFALRGHALVLWCAVLSFVPKHLYYAVAQGSFNEAQWYYVPELLALVLFCGLWCRRTTWPLAAALALAIAWAAWPQGSWRAFADAGFLAWTFAPTAVLLVAAAAVLLRRGAPRAFWLAAAGALLLAAVAVPGRGRLCREAPYATEKARLLQLGRWAHDVQLTAHGTAGAYSSGLVNYFAGGDVTNLDGLVADWQWFELARQNGRIPPPRAENFVLDYHPVPRDQLLAKGYALCLDELPDYLPGATGRRDVFVVTNDLDEAQQVYLDVLARAEAARALRAHAVGVAWRLQLPRVLQALPAEAISPPTAAEPRRERTLPDGAMLLARCSGSGKGLRVLVDGVEVAQFAGGVGGDGARTALDLGSGAPGRVLAIEAIGGPAAPSPFRCDELRLVPVR